MLAAQAAARIGEFEVSTRLTNAALADFEHLQDFDGMLESSHLLGAIAFERGRIREAERRFLAVAHLAEGAGKPGYVARSALALGRVSHLRGEYNRAASLHQRALDVSEQIDDVRGIAEACHLLGTSLREAGDGAEAGGYAMRAVEAAERAGAPGLLAMTLLGRAALKLAWDEFDCALEDIHRAELLAWSEGNEPHRLEAERLTALIALRRGDPVEAHRRACRVCVRAADAQLALLAADARAIVSQALKAMGRHTEAVAAREAATVAFRSLGAAGRMAHLAKAWESL
jgi:tetratricopeptide (TPR) repeat protein